MRTHSFGFRAVPAALATLVLASLAMAGVGPAPARAGSVRAESVRASTVGGPVTAAAADTVAASSSRACQGAIFHRTRADARRLPRLCIAVGGVVQVRNLGPRGLRISNRKADCFYGGAVHTCRLVHTGTVKFTVTVGSRTRTFSVAVTKASVPARPSPACRSRRAVITVDAADQPLWFGPADCAKVGARVRVENLGPGLLRVTPHRAVTCNYAAGVHVCRFRAPATVTFKVRMPYGYDTFRVVAIR